MVDGGGDLVYRGFRLSTVQQGDVWMVTIWPTSVNQALPDGGNVPSQGSTREEALAQAKTSIDHMPDLEKQAAIDASDG